MTLVSLMIIQLAGVDVLFFRKNIFSGRALTPADASIVDILRKTIKSAPDNITAMVSFGRIKLLIFLNDARLIEAPHFSQIYPISILPKSQKILQLERFAELSTSSKLQEGYQ